MAHGFSSCYQSNRFATGIPLMIMSLRHLHNKHLWQLLAFGSMTLALGLCWLLAQQLLTQAPDWEALARGFSLPWLGVTFLLTIALLVTGADKWRRWQALQHPGEPQEKHLTYLRHFSWQIWAGQFLPMPLAIVAGRSLKSAQSKNLSWRAGALNGVWDLAFELLGMICLIPWALTLFLKLDGASSWALATGGFVFVLLLWGLGFSTWGPRWMKPAMPMLMSYSMLRVMLLIVRQLTMTMAIGLPISLSHVAAGMPILTLLALLPLTPGNLGVLEWGWVGLLAVVGEQPEMVALYALLSRMLLILMLALWLGILFMLKKITGRL